MSAGNAGFCGYSFGPTTGFSIFRTCEIARVGQKHTRKYPLYPQIRSSAEQVRGGARCCGIERRPAQGPTRRSGSRGLKPKRGHGFKGEARRAGLPKGCAVRLIHRAGMLGHATTTRPHAREEAR